MNAKRGENATSPSAPEGLTRAPGKGAASWLLLLVFSGLLGAWLWLTPPGFVGKLSALGYAVCHQIPAHSFLLGGQQFPLCARCTGLYLGAMISLGFHFTQGREGLFPRWPQMATLALFLLAFLGDGINSFSQLIPGFSPLYPPGNGLRLATGLGVGLGVGAVFVPAFNQSVWASFEQQAVWASPRQAVLAGGWVALGGLAVVSEVPALQAISLAVSGLGVFVVLSLVYTLAMVLLLRKANTFRRWRELGLPALAGATLALLQISLFSLLRYGLTLSLGGLNL